MSVRMYFNILAEKKKEVISQTSLGLNCLGIYSYYYYYHYYYYHYHHHYQKDMKLL